MAIEKRLFALAALSALAAGCAGGPSSNPSAGYIPSQHSLSQLEALTKPALAPCGTNLKFMSDGDNNYVGVYTGTTNALCAIIPINGTTKLPCPNGGCIPSNIDVDSKGNLYVPEFFGNRVLEIAPPYTGTPIHVFKTTGAYPADVAVCKGYIAVTNKFTTAGPGNVMVWRGTTKTTLVDPTASFEVAAACDPDGNLYTAGKDSSGHAVINYFVGGAGSAIELPSIAAYVTDPAAMDWEGGSLGTLWVLDRANKTISVWSPGQPTPETTITLSGASVPNSFHVSASDNQIFTADNGTGLGELYNLSGKNTGSFKPNNTSPFPANLEGAAYNKDDSP